MSEAVPQKANPLLSVVVPCHNEEQNLRPLVAAIQAALEPEKIDYEIVITDDRSSDRSWQILQELSLADQRVRALRLAKQSGQSAAMWAGFKEAKGAYIATLDADLQNDPRDFPALLAALKQYDCVCGSRVASRKNGDNLLRRISSRIANRVRDSVCEDGVTDAGCCFRVFKRECIANLKFFKGIHRFLPTLFLMEGFTITEVPVRQNPRAAGTSHYGVWNRVFASSYDLMAVRWMKKRMFRFDVADRLN